MPVIILGGIYGGVFTATEAAAVSVIYAAAVCVVIYGQLDLKELWDVCIDSGLASARILIMVGGATLFSWMLTITGTTAALVEPFAGLRSSPAQTLAFVNILALLAGMFIDPLSINQGITISYSKVCSVREGIVSAGGNNLLEVVCFDKSRRWPCARRPRYPRSLGTNVRRLSKSVAVVDIC